MSDRSHIGWTDATWNPVTGCTQVSPGCAHCYAKDLTERFGGVFEHVRLHADRLKIPLHWRKPRRVFVNSMSDLFHEDVPLYYIQQIIGVMRQARWHTFQVLTKRPWLAARAASILAIPDNVWLGVSVEEQHWANLRIPMLLDIPVAVRFVSYEPALGPVDFNDWLTGWDSDCSGCTDSRSEGTHQSHTRQHPGPRIDWVIVGAESGAKRRTFDPQWARSAYEQCQAAGVPCFIKQGSAFRPGQQGNLPDDLWGIWEYPAETPLTNRDRTLPLLGENAHQPL